MVMNEVHFIFYGLKNGLYPGCSRLDMFSLKDVVLHH